MFYLNKLFCTCILVALVSCTLLMREQDVAGFNKNTLKILGQAEKGVKRAETDVLEHEQILVKWGDNKSRQSLSRMRSLHHNILQNYIRIKEDFENSPFRQTLKLKPEDKQYKTFVAFQKDIEARFATLDQQFDKYRAESLGLNAYLETKSVQKLNAYKMNEDFTNSLSEIKKTQLIAKNELMDYNVKLNQMDPKSEESKQQKMNIQELVKVVEKMENETFKLQRLFAAAMKEARSGVKFATPRMMSYNYMVKIQNYLKTIQTQYEEFNLKAKLLKLTTEQ